MYHPIDPQVDELFSLCHSRVGRAKYFDRKALHHDILSAAGQGHRQPDEMYNDLPQALLDFVQKCPSVLTKPWPGSQGGCVFDLFYEMAVDYGHRPQGKRWTEVLLQVLDSLNRIPHASDIAVNRKYLTHMQEVPVAESHASLFAKLLQIIIDPDFEFLAHSAAARGELEKLAELWKRLPSPEAYSTALFHGQLRSMEWIERNVRTDREFYVSALALSGKREVPGIFFPLGPAIDHILRRLEEPAQVEGRQQSGMRLDLPWQVLLSWSHHPEFPDLFVRVDRFIHVSVPLETDFGEHTALVFGANWTREAMIKRIAELEEQLERRLEKEKDRF
ncbi:MAG: hypothetical protein ACYCOU_03510 [Sulfobacillus sp.]